MTATVIVVLAVLIAVLLLAIRVPIMFALGVPALLGNLALMTGNQVTGVGLRSLVGAFNLYSFSGVILWMVIGGIMVESGLMERYLSALHTLLGRQVTWQRREAWSVSIHGLPLTTVALLLVVAGAGLVDDHFLLLLMLVLLIILAIFAGLVAILSAPQVSQMTMKKMRSADGESWKQTAKATAEVTAEGTVHRSSSKTHAALTLLPSFLLALISIVLTLSTPIGLADLGGIVWVVVMVMALSTSGYKWLADAGLQAVLNVAYVASTAASALWMAQLINTAGVIPAEAVSSGSAIIWLLLGAAVLSLLLGEVLGSEAGAVMTVTLLGPFLTAGVNATSVATSVSGILLTMLAVAAVIGGIFARVLPPRTSPWPLTVSPLH
ncbi:hypothetical protein [Mobiluncus curtisii]|uniref:Uncharacterized protein n=1 Tax=Mobiluncus curtisii TaxID=2051 RepID=A0A7Y0UHU8_9ACTO|nr:hypothetical protein [Mobiluncus curtisii]MCU9987619.1 hypothetical protein [Mobiluncus curtisii]MCV0000699.1 hypothetical protein [Mobiluncus curtisii]NMW48524.1 hypothetical protein [Mobiluncus curtisii]NMW87619.1 hypothetical protein [Mobiluncus curtisii]NMX13204.1 hypothetical protein [Mobiluncus curtisii]